ncbi:MAG TPA: carbohydrate kinase [Desulfotomaculum sp.]|nr:MAG: carbohydrate kinase [Peptococcaceae bacterium BRH_c8a]KJS71348.1 MAG: carbohydrate kinase [Desulfotomaculum sp. BICA1-6]HBX23619.1 carbohydrate kinase [Desulfotomaculum sp.]
MHKEIVLAIDVGTQSVRALAFDPRGQIIDSVRIVYQVPYNSPRPGWAEQAPGFYWRNLAESCRKLWARGIVEPESLAAVAVTYQRSTIINLDHNGDPLRPAMVWLDQRRARKLPSVGPLWSAIFGITGLSGTLRHVQAESEANWIRENQPTIWAKTAHFLLLSGYITYRLTGQFVDSTGCQVGFLPFDYKSQTWPPLSHWKWRAIPINPEILPTLVPPGDRLGEVTAEASVFTGLPEGLPVIAAASDKACEVLGAGCLEPHQGCIGYGTTATINVNSQRYIEPVPLIPAYPSACPDAYNLEVQIYRGFWMVSWFKDEFAWPETTLARQSGVEAEELLNRLAEKVRPGSGGLVLQPFWSPGVRYPGPEARGAIIGFNGSHTRGHMYRALLEGMAYAVREGREKIEKRTKVPVAELLVCGGGSRSDVVMQITADVFNLPAVRPSVYEASGLGAAILAMVGAGLQPDLPTAVKEMTGTGQVFKPHPGSVKIYDELYRKVYRRMYRKISPLYKSIMDIKIP